MVGWRVVQEIIRRYCDIPAGRLLVRKPVRYLELPREDL